MLRKICMLLIRFYQKFISPLFPPCCKYYPTCSAYGLRAFEKHGVIKGFILTFWRLLRCNPWSLGGVDQVPEKFTMDYFILNKNGKNTIKFGKKREK